MLRTLDTVYSLWYNAPTMLPALYWCIIPQAVNTV